MDRDAFLEQLTLLHGYDTSSLTGQVQYGVYEDEPLPPAAQHEAVAPQQPLIALHARIGAAGVDLTTADQALHVPYEFTGGTRGRNPALITLVRRLMTAAVFAHAQFDDTAENKLFGTTGIPTEAFREYPYARLLGFAHTWWRRYLVISRQRVIRATVTTDNQRHFKLNPQFSITSELVECSAVFNPATDKLR